MVDVNRTREAIRLAETFEHRDSGAGSSGSSTAVGARQAMNWSGRTRIALATIDGAFVDSQADATVTLADLLEPLVPAVVAARRSLLAKAR